MLGPLALAPPAGMVARISDAAVGAAERNDALALGVVGLPRHPTQSMPRSRRAPSSPLFFISEACRRREPRGPDRHRRAASERSRVEARPSAPSERRASSAFAVGVLRDDTKKRARWGAHARLHTPRSRRPRLADRGSCWPSSFRSPVVKKKDRPAPIRDSAPQPQRRSESLLPARVACLHVHTVTRLQQKWLHSSLTCGVPGDLLIDDLLFDSRTSSRVVLVRRPRLAHCGSYQ